MLWTCKAKQLQKCSRCYLQNNRTLEKRNSIKFEFQHHSKTIEIISLEIFLRKESTKNNNSKLTIKNRETLINHSYIFNIWGFTKVYYSGKTHYLPNFLKSIRKDSVDSRTCRITHYEKNLSRLTIFGFNIIMDRWWALKKQANMKLGGRPPTHIQIYWTGNNETLRKKFKQYKKWNDK